MGIWPICRIYLRTAEHNGWRGGGRKEELRKGGKEGQTGQGIRATSEGEEGNVEHINRPTGRYECLDVTYRYWSKVYTFRCYETLYWCPRLHL